MKTHRYYKQKYVKRNDNANTKKTKKQEQLKKLKRVIVIPKLTSEQDILPEIKKSYIKGINISNVIYVLVNKRDSKNMKQN